MANNTAWLLLRTVMVLLRRRTGGLVTAIATAASSAVYGFCSVLGPRVTEYRIGPSSTSAVLSIMAPPSPTTLFLADELIAICIPSGIGVSSLSICTSTRASYGPIVYG